ncbi:MAG: DUF1638 domain-containing protein [Halobacteriota archaeon]|jgi:hypothetical protein
MPVLSIISCGMLEDELTHVLSEDKELNHLILVDAAEIYGLARKLRAQNRPFLTADLTKIPNLLKKQHATPFSRVPTMRTRIVDAVRRLRHGRSMSDAVVANVLKMDLHGSPELLKREVYRNIESMSSFSNGILVLYGLCESLRDLERDFAGCKPPLYFLADECGTRVEDCIALALGGNQSFWQTSSIHSNIVFFSTPMWASNWQSLSEHSKMDQKLTQSVEKLLKHARFKLKLKVAKVDTGLRYEPNFDENTRDYARQRQINVIQLRGNTDIVERCYQKAKSSVRKRIAE